MRLCDKRLKEANWQKNMAQKAQKFNIVWVLALLVLAVLVISGMHGGVAPTTQTHNTAQGEVTLTVIQPPVQEQGKIQLVVEKPKVSSTSTG